MNIKLQNLLLLLIFTNFYNIIMCMENVENFSQEAADKQLLGIAEAVVINESGTCKCLIATVKAGGINLCFSNESLCLVDKPKDFQKGSHGNFDLRPLEEAVKEHKEGKLLDEKRRYWYRINRPKQSEIYNPNFHLEVVEVSKELINEKINIDKNSLGPTINTNLALEYKNSEKNPVCKKLLKNLDSNFDEYLKKYFPSSRMEKQKKKDLSTIKNVIESYLSKGAKVTLALKYCILDNKKLFRSNNSTTESNSSGEFIEFGNASYNKDEFIKFAQWLLYEKKGWCYLNELLYQVTQQSDEYDQFLRFMRCLALIKHFDIFNQENINNIFYEKVKNTKTNWYISLSKANLVTEEGLNGALKKLIESEQDYNGYFNTIDKLLDLGADPNELFYIDENNQKRCRLKKAWVPWQYGNKTTELLRKVLLHPKRTTAPNEPTDFDYLTHPEDQPLFCFSMLANKKYPGQKKLFEYGKKVYRLAFEACKSGKTIQLRQYILKYYAPESLYTEKSSTYPGRLICDIPTCNKHSNRQDFSQLNENKEQPQQQSYLSNFYFLVTICLGKIYSLKNILPQRTIFWGYHIRPKKNN